MDTTRRLTARRSGDARRLLPALCALLLLAGGCGQERDASTQADAAPKRSEDSARGFVWVAEEGADSIALLDGGDGRVLTRLTGIPEPHNVQASLDGSMLLATSTAADAVLSISTRNLGPAQWSAVGDAPAHVIEVDAGRGPASLVTTESGDASLAFIDHRDRAARARTSVGDAPHGARPSPDGSKIAVANLGGRSVSIVDATTRRELALVELPGAPVQVGWSLDGATIYATLGDRDSVAVIDARTNRLDTEVAVGSHPAQLVVVPGDGTVLVANQGTEQAPDSTMSVIDPLDLQVVDVIEVGSGAHGIVTDDRGRFAWVTNAWDDSVSLVDLESRTVRFTADVGDAPNGIAWTSSGPDPNVVPSIALQLPAWMSRPASGDAADAGHEH